MLLVTSYFAQLRELLGRVDLQAVMALAQAVRQTAEAEGTVFTFGNGGSAATALHFVNDLLRPRRGSKQRARCLIDNMSVISALANDFGYDQIYVMQLSVLASPGDLAIALSVSGTSPNCVNGLRRAREMGLVTACLVGFDGGQLLALSDYSVHIPCNSYALVEDVHLAITHSIACGATPELAP